MISAFKFLLFYCGFKQMFYESFFVRNLNKLYHPSLPLFCCFVTLIVMQFVYQIVSVSVRWGTMPFKNLEVINNPRSNSGRILSDVRKGRSPGTWDPFWSGVLSLDLCDAYGRPTKPLAVIIPVISSRTWYRKFKRTANNILIRIPNAIQCLK